MTAHDAAHARLRDTLEADRTVDESAAGGPSLRLSALGAAACLALLVVVIAL